jgi:catalase
VHNNQRDGMHRQAIARGRVAYEPNSLGGGCPFQAGVQGFTSFPQPVREDKVRGKPEKFADHYTQAKLFFDSQTPVEQAHIAAAFRFELSKVTVPAIRERMVASLRNASEPLAAQVADGLGMALPLPMPRALDKPKRPEVKQSPALSLMARPGDGGVRTRKVAILVCDGVEATSLLAVQRALFAAGAIPRLVGPRIGPFKAADGEVLDADASMENEPSPLFDAMVLPDGEVAVKSLARYGQVAEFIKDQYRHCKTILAFGASNSLLEAAGAFATLPDGSPDPGILLAAAAEGGKAARAFIEAIAMHRHFLRETDPPAV